MQGIGSKGFRRSLAPGSLVLMAMKRSWWRSKRKGFAARLRNLVIRSCGWNANSGNEENMKSRTNAAPAGAPRVLIASTAMLAFISFWQAAAVVLNDMGSSAFYAGAIAEHFIGKTAPWFILAIMVLSFAVRSLYIESCSMFVRGGVYRVVKEAMGSMLAKFSVSALMFDYILTGPISGVSAGLYLVGLINEVLALLPFRRPVSGQCDSRILRDSRDDLLLVGEHQRNTGIERKSTANHVRHHCHGGADDRMVHLHSVGQRRRTCRRCRISRTSFIPGMRWAG